MHVLFHFFQNKHVSLSLLAFFKTFNHNISTEIKLFLVEEDLHFAFIMLEISYASTYTALCDSTLYELLGRWPWNSAHRQVLLLTMSLYSKNLEKISMGRSDDKNLLFTFFLETKHLTNESFGNFAQEFIINH